MSYAVLPNYSQSIVQKGVTDRAWYTFFQGLWQGSPPQAENSVTPGASPYTYKASRRGFLIIQGGTMGIVQFSRSGTQNYNTGVTQGCFPLSDGDSLVMTFGSAPTLPFVPQ